MGTLKQPMWQSFTRQSFIHKFAASLRTLFCCSAHKEPTTRPEEDLELSATDGADSYTVTLGQILNSRYAVIRKLGWGQHSGVWLARDINEHQSKHYVAVKVLTSHATRVQGEVAHELDILKHIRDVSMSMVHPGANQVTALLDNFQLEDKHGSYLCLVSDAMSTFTSLQGEKKQLPVAWTTSVARQLLLALDFLHSECGVIHTDIKPDNILIKLDNVEEVLGKDATEQLPTQLSTEDTSQAVLSHSINAVKPTKGSSEFHIQLTDFGTAVMVNGPHTHMIQPYALRAPEVILGCGWSTSADIWNLGCLLFEFLTGSWLFSPRGGPTWTPEEYHLAHMPGVCGEEFDVTYSKDGQYFDKYFQDDGQLRIKVQGVRSLEEALRNYKVLDDVEMPICVSFLRSMLRLMPSDRASAAQLLGHEWLKP